MPVSTPSNPPNLSRALGRNLPGPTSRSSLPAERPLGPACAFSFRVLWSGGSRRRNRAGAPRLGVRIVLFSSVVRPSPRAPRGEASPLIYRAPVPRLRRDARERHPTCARPCDARGASGLRAARGLRVARGLRAFLGGPLSAFGASSISARSARVLPPSFARVIPPPFTCLRRRRAPRAATRRACVRCRVGNRRERRNGVHYKEAPNSITQAEFHAFGLSSTPFS